MRWLPVDLEDWWCFHWFSGKDEPCTSLASSHRGRSLSLQSKIVPLSHSESKSLFQDFASVGALRTCKGISGMEGWGWDLKFETFWKGGTLDVLQGNNWAKGSIIVQLLQMMVWSIGNSNIDCPVQLANLANSKADNLVVCDAESNGEHYNYWSYSWIPYQARANEMNLFSLQ